MSFDSALVRIFCARLRTTGQDQITNVILIYIHLFPKPSSLFYLHLYHSSHPRHVASSCVPFIRWYIVSFHFTSSCFSRPDPIRLLFCWMVSRFVISFCLVLPRRVVVIIVVIIVVVINHTILSRATSVQLVNHTSLQLHLHCVSSSKVYFGHWLTSGPHIACQLSTRFWRLDGTGGVAS